MSIASLDRLEVIARAEDECEVERRALGVLVVRRANRELVFRKGGGAGCLRASVAVDGEPEADVVVQLDRAIYSVQWQGPEQGRGRSTPFRSSVVDSFSRAGQTSVSPTDRSNTVTTTSPRPRRTQAHWEELAREIQPELPLSASALQERVGTNIHAFRVALARQGSDLQGQPLKLKPVTGRKPEVIAKRLAKRREEGTPWWRLEAESGLSYGAMKTLLTDNGFGHLTGRSPSGTNGQSAA